MPHSNTTPRFENGAEEATRLSASSELFNNWLAIQPVTFKSHPQGRHLKVAVDCDQYAVVEPATRKTGVLETSNTADAPKARLDGWQCLVVDPLSSGLVKGQAVVVSDVTIRRAVLTEH